MQASIIEVSAMKLLISKKLVQEDLTGEAKRLLIGNYVHHSGDVGDLICRQSYQIAKGNGCVKAELLTTRKLCLYTTYTVRGRQVPDACGRLNPSATVIPGACRRLQQ